MRWIDGDRDNSSNGRLKQGKREKLGSREDEGEVDDLAK